MKKYKNILLFLLVILSIVLNNYKKYNNNKIQNIESDSLSYFVNYTKYSLAEDYIYVGDDSDSEILSSVSISSGRGRIEDGYLRFYNLGYLIDEWLLVRVNLGNLSIDAKSIIIKENMPYEEFTNNITTTYATYKIFDNNSEITSGNISAGMQLKFYYEDKEIDSYNIINDYLNLEKLNIKDEKYIITNLSTVGNIKQKIDTNGIISVVDKDGNILVDDKYIPTDSKLIIKLSNKTHEYTVITIGDVTGSGNIFIGDVSKLYQYHKGIIEMEECYIIAGDVTYDGKIGISDVAKLYQYHKGVINSL